MEWITDYVKQIACVSLFVSFFKKIIPNDKYSKYADMTIGIIMILVVIRPVMVLIHSEGIFEYNLHKKIDEYVSEEKDLPNNIMKTYMSDGYVEEVWNDYDKNENSIYTMAFKEKINELIADYDYYVKKFEYTDDNRIDIVLSVYAYKNNIGIDVEDVACEYKKVEYTPKQIEVINRIYTYFGTDESQVNIQFEK